MKKRSKVNLSLITDETSKRETFKRRKKGIMKKLKELVTLCNIKACAVIHSPYDSNLEAWPSRKGAEDMMLRFMELPMQEQNKNMVDQEAYVCERIRKEKEQVNNLRAENRKFELKELMFDCLKGKMIEHYPFNTRDIQDLRDFVDHYLNQLNRRIDILKENSEFSSFQPIHAAAITDMTHVAAENADVVTAPIHVRYQNINMNQQEPVQYQAPVKFYDHIQYHNVTQQPIQYLSHENFYDCLQYQEMDQQNPVQFQAHADFYDPRTNDVHSNQIMNLDSNHNMCQNLNQYPNQQQSFTDQLMKYHRQMGYIGELTNIHSMDNDYQHQQPPTTYQMTFITTTATADLYAPNINNNLWETGIGYE